MRASHALRGWAFAAVAVASSVAVAATAIIVAAVPVTALRRRRRNCRAARVAPLALALALTSPAVAAAQITATWRHVLITPAAVASDPALAGMQTWEVVVATTGDWASAGIIATLPHPHTFYNAPQGGHTRPSPATVQAHPHVEFDTYVTAPMDNGTTGAPALLGGNCGCSMSLGGREINVSWGNLEVDAPGSYPIMRLTFPIGVLPDVVDEPVSSQSYVAQVSPSADTFIPDIPEPSGFMAITGAAALLIACRRGTRITEATCAK